MRSSDSKKGGIPKRAFVIQSWNGGNVILIGHNTVNIPGMFLMFTHGCYTATVAYDVFMFFFLATPPTVEEILDKMNYELVMSLTVEAPVSKFTLVFVTALYMTFLLVLPAWSEHGNGVNNGLPLVLLFQQSEELIPCCSNQLLHLLTKLSCELELP